jgi:hypothetical protein
MVDAPKKNLLPLPAGKYTKSTQQSTRRCHPPNSGKSGFEIDRVQALGALRSRQSKKKLSVEKRWESHIVSNEEKEEWIADDVAQETAGARERVENAETAIMQEQEAMRNTEKERLTTRKPEK